MRIPQFTAEASLEETNNGFYTKKTSSTNIDANVIPQMRVRCACTADGGYCCCNYGGRFIVCGPTTEA